MTAQMTALALSRGLRDAEEGADALVAAIANLTAAMTTARIEHSVSAAHTQRPIARAIAAQAKLAEARQDLVRVHEDLRQLGIRMDIPDRCPEDTFTIAAADEPVTA